MTVENGSSTSSQPVRPASGPKPAMVPVQPQSRTAISSMPTTRVSPASTPLPAIGPATGLPLTYWRAPTGGLVVSGTAPSSPRRFHQLSLVSTTKRSPSSTVSSGSRCAPYSTCHALSRESVLSFSASLMAMFSHSPCLVVGLADVELVGVVLRHLLEGDV